ncbi:MAG: tetratricopeptide repeat protein [Betaproteobacteria bacterium]
MKNKVVATMVLLLGLSCVGGAALARDWTQMGRERALEQTRSTQSAERRLAYARLAEVGTMDDVPVLLAALWDDDELIRGIAEQSVWGIWLRTDDPIADPLFQTGMALIAENDAPAAVKKFEEVMALKPDFAEVWNKRGDAYAALGDEERALADYAQALKLNPYEFGAMQSSGEIWMSRSNYRKAAEFFRRALEINPTLYEAAEILQSLEEKLENDRI